MRYLGAPLAHAIERNTWAQAGALRNLWAGEGTVIAGASIAHLSGVPDGALHPASWLMPPKAGGMSSRFAAALAIGATGLAVGGITTTGSAALSITAPAADILPADDTPPARTASASFAFAASATGGLIATSDGAASFTIAGSGALLGILSGAGSAALAIAANTPTLGALASLTGTAGLSIGAIASILPADDTPPARTASASFAFGGSLTPYAIGSMTGSTLAGAAELTADAVATATVAALQATAIPVDLVKVNGIDVAGAGTSGDPWGPA